MICTVKATVEILQHGVSIQTSVPEDLIVIDFYCLIFILSFLALLLEHYTHMRGSVTAVEEVVLETFVG